jgi:hypothetical protein
LEPPHPAVGSMKTVESKRLSKKYVNFLPKNLLLRGEEVRFFKF